MSIIQVLLIILILSIFIMIGVISSLLRKLGRSVDVLGKEIHQLVDIYKPAVHNFKNASIKFRRVKKDIGNITSDVKYFVDRTKITIDRLETEFKKDNRKKIAADLVSDLYLFKNRKNNNR